jgi:bisphosphoglycerate-independent phosphoglycerate mutase (AlkP superfamily)
MPHILLIFLDGVGLGDDNPATNPFSAGDFPTLHTLTNGLRWTRDTGIQSTPRSLFIPTDAQMSVAGLPQSGTGQATIVTGRNIPQLIGEHYGPKPNIATRELLDEANFFKEVVAHGKTAALLEAYPPPWHKGINSGKSLPSSYQYALKSAGIRFFDETDLREGRAISGDWTGAGWHSQLGYTDTPILTPFDVGVRLVEISRGYDFAFFAHWLTDVIGHRGTLLQATDLLTTFDGVMAGVLSAWNDDEGVVIITSDHGNIEDIGNRHHTANRVPTVIIGEQKDSFANLDNLADIVPCMRQILGMG